VYSRAHRAFRHTPRFKLAPVGDDELANYRARIKSNAFEDLVGYYRNPEPASLEAVVITERGLLTIRPGLHQWIEFSDIKSIVGPRADTGSSEISLVLLSGIVVRFAIEGREGKYRDVFSFVRFLDRVIEDRGRLRLHRSEAG
jgi:hypothetical protein